MNLAECYNSKYVRCNEINLKLIDSAKLDTAAALQYERTYKKYGDGMPVAGKGPSESQRFGKDITDQCRRSRKYAESILNDSDELNCKEPITRAALSPSDVTDAVTAGFDAFPL